MIPGDLEKFLWLSDLHFGRAKRGGGGGGGVDYDTNNGRSSVSMELNNSNELNSTKFVSRRVVSDFAAAGESQYLPSRGTSL